MTEQEYCDYLKSRSKASLFYRKNFLYPKIIQESKGKILDYGCGIGDFLISKIDAVGVDINKSCVDYCKQRNLIAFHIENSVIPLSSNSFDTIILDNVYEHISDPSLIMDEINRVLNKNGLLIIGVPGVKGYKADKTHIKFYNESELKKSLNNFGFIAEKFFYTPLIKSQLLSNHLKIYVTWGVFKKIS